MIWDAAYRYVLGSCPVYYRNTAASQQANSEEQSLSADLKK
jgi:hypothetical protein